MIVHHRVLECHAKLWGCYLQGQGHSKAHAIGTKYGYFYYYNSSAATLCFMVDRNKAECLVKLLVKVKVTVNFQFMFARCIYLLINGTVSSL